MVVGSGFMGYTQHTAIFDLDEYTFEYVGQTSYGRTGTSLVRLRDHRVFAIGGGFNPLTSVVEEFDLDTQTWSDVENFKLIELRKSPATLNVPAYWFDTLPGGCLGVV